jgi:hypothetical protein
MTAEEARQRVLRSIDAARHVEPFRWGGVTYGARVPDRLQLEIATNVARQTGPCGWLASLIVQCCEFNGRLMFQVSDISRLLHDESHGFSEAFRRAIAPFLSAPPVCAAMERAR